MLQNRVKANSLGDQEGDNGCLSSAAENPTFGSNVLLGPVTQETHDEVRTQLFK